MQVEDSSRADKGESERNGIREGGEETRSKGGWRGKAARAGKGKMAKVKDEHGRQKEGEESEWEEKKKEQRTVEERRVLKRWR